MHSKTIEASAKLIILYLMVNWTTRATITKYMLPHDKEGFYMVLSRYRHEFGPYWGLNQYALPKIELMMSLQLRELLKLIRSHLPTHVLYATRIILYITESCSLHGTRVQHGTICNCRPTSGHSGSGIIGHKSQGLQYKQTVLEISCILNARK